MSENDWRRRSNDEKMAKLITDVADLKISMVQNTIITEQVRDVLASFRIMASVSKWLAAISAGAIGLWHAWTKLKGG